MAKRKINESNKVRSQLKINKYTDKSTLIIFTIFDVVNLEQNSSKVLNFKNISSKYNLGYWSTLLPQNYQPINSGYIYDAVNDVFVIECCDYYILGHIPFYFKAKMDKVGLWEVPIPIPESILELYFDKNQLEIIESLKKKKPEPRFDYSFLQFV